MADRSDRLPPYRRPEGEEDLFTPAAGVRYPVQPVPPPPGRRPLPPQPGDLPAGDEHDPDHRGAGPADAPPAPGPARPMSRREAREAARRARPAQPAEQPAEQPTEQPTEQPWPAAAPVSAPDGWPLDPVRGTDREQTAPPAGPAPDGRGVRGRLRSVVDRATDVPPGRWWTMPLAAALLAGWAATVFADVGGPLGVVPVVLATLAPLVSVLAIPVATIALRRRRWESVVVAVAAALLPWYFVLSYATAEPPPTKPGIPATVLVVNAHAGRASAQDIVAAVRAHDVDVVVVTELSRTLSNDLTRGGLGTYVQPRWFAVDDVPERGIGIWSRLDVLDPKLLPGTTWPAVSVTVQTRSGDLTVVAGHAVPPVPNDVDRWTGDLDAFKAATRGQEHVLLVGTFNASPWHAQYRHLLGRRLVDATDALGRGLRPTWPTWTPLPLVPMDSAAVGRDVRVDAADTVQIDDTDHRALLVTLQVPGEVAPGD